jgi:ActR/RegA family two-component response regulator
MEREELAYKRELIKAHEKRLKELEIQAAIKGVNTPAEIKTEIKDIGDAIENLERDIKKAQLLSRDDVDYREKRKVLIIDDDVEWVNRLASKLTEWDYDVIRALKGVDGVRLATLEKPDVVLLDLYMPDMHGHNVLLKIVERRVATRVIILSGIENIGISVLIKSGACDYVNKSEGFERLKSAIERAIELVPTVDVIIENPLSIINPLLM